VRLKDGRVLHTSVQHARGTVFRPFSRAELDEKFRDCAQGLIPPAAFAALRRDLPEFDALPSVRDLMQSLRFAAHADRGERFLCRPYEAAPA
jgi:hypothetical protein